MMSSMDSKRSKRRRNKRGSAKARQKVCNVGGVTNSNAVANSVNVDGDSFSHAQLSANLKKMPSSLSVSELDLDNIPQRYGYLFATTGSCNGLVPLTQLPKSHNPYLDREHCLLCRRERPDPPRSSLNLTMGDDKEGDDQIPITPQMPLWLCPECRQNVEEEERNSKSFDASCMQPQDVFVSSHLPLITSSLDAPIDLSAGDGISGPKSSEDPCSCMKCKEQRLIIAEEEKAKIKLAECWSELSHMVRCVYLEAGTALADEDSSSSTKLCLPRIAELVQRLCAHDPHQLFLRLEIEVEDFVKEVKERLLKRLGEGYKSPQLAKQFMTMLMEEYTSLISASKTLSTVLDKLEKEHLSKFNLTWVLHNKHLFHSMVYLEPELHNKLGQLLKYLQQGSQKESYHSEESFSKLCQRYLKFSDEMTELSEGWREHQQLIESYVEKREISRTRELLAQQRTNWDFKFPPFPPSGDMKGHSSKCSHRSKECSQSGDTKQSVDHTPCNCKAKCSYQTHRNSHQNSLDYISLEDGLIPPQLAALDGYNYLQSIQPPNLSSPNSSQDDSEEMVPIFSRPCIDPGMCSPCSEDSIDSDDLTSESSQDATSQDAGYEEDDESEGCNYNKKSRNSTTTNEKLSNGSNNTKGEPPYQTNQTCECHACITSAMQSAKLLPATAMATSTTDTSTTLSPNELRTQTAPYLFYSNLSNHQPLDLSHHGITAKHPLIHPHLYNLSSQKPTSSVQPQPFQFVDTPLHLSSEVNAYESAKMSLHSRGYDTDPDLLQSVKDALQTNCKLDKSGLLSSYVGKAHGKDHEEGGTGSPKLCNQTNRDSNVGLYNSAQFSVDAWAQQQLMAQFHQQQQHNGTIGPTTATNTHTSDCCPKHLGQSPRITNTAAKGHLFTHGTTATTTATLSATQQPLVQPISPLLQNLPTSDPQLFGTIKHGPLVDSSVSQSMTPSFQTPSHQHGQHHQTTCKKKKGGDLERYHQGCNMSCSMQVSDFGQDVHQQSVCALHNQHGITSSQGSAVDPVSLHTAGSTSTSASVCSDPDCDTHNFDDDLYPNSDDRSSSTTSSSRERDSKHCGCCYCEVFGHGGPALAPMSRNYPEIRDRLRLKLRERQQTPKDESPSHTHSPVSTNQTRSTAIPQNDLDTIVSFINGEKPKPKSNTSSKAAKRQRQKQRKAEQRAKQESRSKGSDCPSREQPPEKCHNLSTQSTPTKSNKAKHNATHSSSTDEQPVSKTDLSNWLVNETQHTQAPGKLKGPEKKQAKSTEVEPAPSTVNSSNKSVSAQKPTEDRRKEKRPKSAGFTEVGESNRVKEVSQKKTDKKNDSLAEKTAGSARQTKKDSGKQLQDGQKAVAQKGTDGLQQGLSNGHMKDSITPSSKGASGGVHSSPATPRKVASKKESVKKEANAPSTTDERKKPVQNGLIQNKPETKETKQGNKFKGKNGQGDENTKKHNGSSTTSVKSGSKKKEAVLENGFVEVKNHVIGKQPNSHKKPEQVVKATSKVNGIIERENHRMDLSLGNATSNTINTSSKKKKKKKGGENTNSLMIDEIFLPKENVDMNEMDEVEQELEAFKRFCMDSTPQRKKEKVVFNVKDIILNAKKTSAH